MNENGKKIWITGASSGIGKALAIKFANNGWQVATSARRENLLQDLNKINSNISSFPLDVRDENLSKVTFENIIEKFKTIDICVFCTGIHDPDAEKKASASTKSAGDATKKASAPGGEKNKESGEEVDDGETKVDKTSIPNQEEVEDDSETPQLDEMSKSELLKQAVASMKEMDLKTLRAAHAGLSEADEDGDDEEKTESETSSAAAV